MNDLHLRPRTVTELVDAAFTLYRRNPAPYVVASAVALSPVVVIEAALPIGLTDLTLQGAMGVQFAARQLVNWIGYLFASALIAKLGSDAYLGGEPDVAVAMRHVGPRAPAVLLTSVLKLPLYFLGALALGVGVLYVTARWFAVATVVVLESESPVRAFGRSSQLSDGRKRHILNTIALMVIIYTVFMFGVGFVAGMFDNTVVTRIMTSAFMIVGYPAVALTNLVLYYDARIRGEGFDLEQMAGALDAPAVTA
jgi:hypothetical protein